MTCLSEQAELYFELANKPSLSPAEQLRLNICRQTLQSSNITDRSALARIKAIQHETCQKIAALENSFKDCKKMYEVYSDIAKTYYAISKGDYVSKLIIKQINRSNAQNIT